MGFNGDLYPTAGATSVLSTKGDIVRYDSQRERYGIGSTNQILQVTAGGLPAWQTLSTAGSVLTTQGDVLYESASGLARLGFGTSGDVLTTKGTGANPVWETPAGGGGNFEFLETFTQPSTADFMNCELATDYVYADNEYLFVAINGKMATSGVAYPNQLGIGYHTAITGTTYLTSDNFTVGNSTVNPTYVGYAGYFIGAKDGSLILCDATTAGSGYMGLSTDQSFTVNLWITGDTLGNPTHSFSPIVYAESSNPAMGSMYKSCAYHEQPIGSAPATLSAIRFYATQGTGYTEETNGIGINSTASFWKVTR